MPRTAIAPFALAGAYPSLPVAAGALTPEPVTTDPANGNVIAFGTSGRILLVVMNTDAANPHTITVHSSTDAFNRVGDLTSYEVEAAPEAGQSAIALLGPFQRGGWQQSDKGLYVTTDSDLMKIIAVKV